MASELAESLANLFLLYSYTWTKDGEELVPNANDMDETLDRLEELMYNDEEAYQVETGNLLVKRDGDHLDVYVRIGDTSDRNPDL